MPSTIPEPEKSIPNELTPIHAPNLKKSFERRRIPFLVITVVGIGFTVFATMFLSIRTYLHASWKDEKTSISDASQQAATLGLTHP